MLGKYAAKTTLDKNRNVMKLHTCILTRLATCAETKRRASERARQATTAYLQMQNPNAKTLFCSRAGRACTSLDGCWGRLCGPSAITNSAGEAGKLCGSNARRLASLPWPFLLGSLESIRQMAETFTNWKVTVPRKAESLNADPHGSRCYVPRLARLLYKRCPSQTELTD